MSEEPKKNEKTPHTYFDLVKFTFLKIVEKKKYYLIPLWILVSAIALILVLSGNAHLLPAIYLAF